MLSTLAIAIPAGLHIALSANLGYTARFAEGLPAEAKAFSLVGFFFTAIMAIIAMSMLLFFGGSIPTMAYSVGLVSLMLRWVGKRWGREKLAASIIGGVMGLAVGCLETLVVVTLMNLSLTWPTYATLFRWPAILTVDGIALLWFSLAPFVNAVAGVQIGYRLGKQLEEMTTYWFW
jgi:riboflavin transporter FmnP